LVAYEALPFWSKAGVDFGGMGFGGVGFGGSAQVAEPTMIDNVKPIHFMLMSLSLGFPVSCSSRPCFSGN
jgi:hypothetical protein